MISTIRNTPFAFASVRNGSWRTVEDRFRGRELKGLQLGIIGYGRIGSNLSRYSLAFGMKVIAYDPYIIVDKVDVNQVSSVNNLLTQADVVAVCVHLDDKTHQMINSEVFEKMKNVSKDFPIS